MIGLRKVKRRWADQNTKETSEYPRDIFASLARVPSWAGTTWELASLWKHIPMVWQVDEGWLVRDGSSKASRWHGEIRDVLKSHEALWPLHICTWYLHILHILHAYVRPCSSNIPNDSKCHICWVTLNNKWYPSEDWCQQFQRNWKMHAINIPQPGWGRSWHCNGDRQRMKEKEQKNDVDTCRHGMMDEGNWRNMKDRSAVCPPSPSKRWSHDFSHVILHMSRTVLLHSQRSRKHWQILTRNWQGIVTVLPFSIVLYWHAVPRCLSWPRFWLRIPLQASHWRWRFRWGRSWEDCKGRDDCSSDAWECFWMSHPWIT